MGKKKTKHRRKRKSYTHSVVDNYLITGSDGFHAFMPGAPPSPDQLEEWTQKYQENIRNSPLWDKIIEKYGQQEAEKILKQCKVELR
jgi:hypothetical protein